MLRILYLLYFCLIAFPLFTVCTILCTLVTVIGCSLGGRRIFAYYPGMIWSKVAIILSGCRIKVQGREHIRPKQNYVVVANHQGAFDIFMMYGHLGIPFRWVMKDGIRKIPFVGLACRYAGFIFVDDRKPSSIQYTMRQAKKVLSENTSIFIFPEGSRTTNGRMGRFKKGAILMADELDIPLLPVSIEGSYKTLPIGKVLPRPTLLKLTIHPEMKVSDFGEKPQAFVAAAEAAKRSIASALPLEQN
ncbi:acyl-phosphate glycerol 3-phosphate acyltransferase [Porphyromonas crevioricanis]|uniref:1-acyl-sn-glycerol-3-phosphate acyltransferase n=1 Tax=Porphyromonas crevioricanis TaxID=393921 RepID=A0A0A2FFH1_9PORP|nr:lysophospholipid acyltransferase family protein [Porphyromonas crevioricanis]KGN89743.1 acyl-phosphate glycerol 3-phosphate acyltransferase [Porphyromonas crevioricanis]SJZ76034.1 1-acyl-sn-glycerol-3-phosphate acyltransferase [Porphyromonas crevioricanis]SQH72305.1 1-acyl-sn-glycerol-3-phosphate acyltransferase [Porphyromonas crevioricanis]